MAPSVTKSEDTEDLQEYRTAVLTEEIERAFRNRQWLEVQRLAGALHELDPSPTLDIDGSFPTLTSANETSRSDMDSDYSISSHSSSSRINNYDRLTVLQARPLVYFSEDGVYEPMPPINFRWEKEAIVRALKDARQNGTIDVVFDVATFDRLNACMADVQNIPILHISCHGLVDGNLAFEDERGRLNLMTPENLAKYPALSSLSVVFVSACHSQSIGAALINAGVKHVICCTNEAKLKDSAAIEFAAAFYRALAHGGTLKDAFDLAKAQVKHSTKIDESHVEVDKFVLLPDRGDVDDYDTYHNVPIFFQRNTVRPLIVDENPRRISIPELSTLFMDRKREAFDIVNGLLG